MRVRATLDDERLRRAFETVVGRHEILRTRLGLDDGTPFQEAFDAPPFALTVADLRSLPRRRGCRHAPTSSSASWPDARSRSRATSCCAPHSCTSHDDEDLLLVVFHHMGSDHLAAGLLFEELDETYRALADGSRAGAA